MIKYTQIPIFQLLFIRRWAKYNLCSIPSLHGAHSFCSHEGSATILVSYIGAETQGRKQKKKQDVRSAEKKEQYSFLLWFIQIQEETQHFQLVKVLS